MLSSSRSSSSHRSEKSRALRRSRGACFTREDQVVSRREDSASFIGYSWWLTFEELEESKCMCKKICLCGKTCYSSSPNKHNNQISSLNILQSLTKMVYLDKNDQSPFNSCIMNVLNNMQLLQRFSCCNKISKNDKHYVFMYFKTKTIHSQDHQEHAGEHAAHLFAVVFQTTQLL